jgi:hypothetical protein
MIDLDYYFGQHEAEAAPGELTDEIRANGAITVDRANQLLTASAFDFGQRSGWRPAATNAVIPNAAVKSKHMTGQAVDIVDDEGELDQWCLDNPETLEQIGLWQEHPSATKGWCHVQIVPPKSGRRVFYP